MSRRRYISTKISQDAKLNRLATTAGDFAALLYTWMIPHAEDDGTLTGDPDEILMLVVPGRRDKTAEDVAEALRAMDEIGLISWPCGETEQARVAFPESFFGYQTYIPRGKRPISPTPPTSGPATSSPRNAEERRRTPRDTENGRASPPITVSPSLSPSLSPSPTPSPSGQGDLAERERNAWRVTPPARTREGQADSHAPPPFSLSHQASFSERRPPRPHPPDVRPDVRMPTGLPADYAPLADALADELGFAPPRDWLPRLANGGLTPETVPKTCRLYRETFGPGIPLTPRALHNNLPHLLAKVNGHGDLAQRAARRAAIEEDEAARLADLKARLVREIPGELFAGGIARAVC